MKFFEVNYTVTVYTQWQKSLTGLMFGEGRHAIKCYFEFSRESFFLRFLNQFFFLFFHCFIFVHRRMSKTDWGTYKQIIEKLKIADIVEIDRCDYKHFVMFWTIHEDTNKNTSRAVCFHVYVDDDGDGKRHMQYLDEVVGQDQCRRNNLTKEAKSRGLTERPKEDQIKEASIGLSTFDITSCCYHYLSNNCETHVTNWKYTGAGFSKQVYENFKCFFLILSQYLNI